MAPPLAPALPLHRRAVVRLALAVTVGLLTSALVALVLRRGWEVSVLAGWDAGGLVLVGTSWFIIASSTAAATRERAGSEDPGRTAVWAVVSLGGVIGLLAASVMLHRAHGLGPGESDALVALSLTSVFLAWVLTHTVFALRYARLYYRADGAGEGGIEFPGGEAPDDLDFAYVAFTLGICFQVSDTALTDRTIRRTALLQAVLAFVYNTTILALTLNLLFTFLN